MDPLPPWLWQTPSNSRSASPALPSSEPLTPIHTAPSEENLPTTPTVHSPQPQLSAWPSPVARRPAGGIGMGVRLNALTSLQRRVAVAGLLVGCAAVGFVLGTLGLSLAGSATGTRMVAATVSTFLALLVIGAVQRLPTPRAMLLGIGAGVSLAAAGYVVGLVLYPSYQGLVVGTVAGGTALHPTVVLIKGTVVQVRGQAAKGERWNPAVAHHTCAAGRATCRRRWLS